MSCATSHPARVPSAHPASSSAAKPQVPALVLTCMDYRYPHLIVDTLDGLDLRGKYDHLVLPGASLGVVHNDAWKSTFFDSLGFAIEHHGVSRLIILEHRDCGAYREFLGISGDDPNEEATGHAMVSQAAIDQIVQSFPQLKGRTQVLLLPNEQICELAPRPVDSRPGVLTFG